MLICQFREGTLAVNKPFFHWPKSDVSSGSTSLAKIKTRYTTVWCLALLAVLSSTGCHRALYSGGSQMVDNTFLSYRDYVWANRAYNLTYRGQQRDFGDHHRKGFIEGYCNACEGGDGYVPPLPPDEYWSYEYKSDEGARCVEAWYEGFPEGVAAARKTGAEKFRSIYVSKMVDAAIAQEQTGAVLPSEKQKSPSDLDEHAPLPPPAPSRLALPKIPILGNSNPVPMDR